MSQVAFVVLSQDEGVRDALEALGHAEVAALVRDPAALEPLVRRRRPDALLVDLRFEPRACLEAVARLPAPRPVLLVIGPDDRELMLRSMRLGAREYLSPPFELDRDLAQGVERILLDQSSTAPLPGGPVVAVMGAKGGVGATFLACQLGAAFAREQRKAAVVDLHLRLGDVALYLDLQPRYGMANLAVEDAAVDGAYLETILAPHATGARVLAAPTRPEEADAIAPAHVEQALPLLRRAHDWVVIDVPRGLDDVALVTLERADLLLLVTTPEVPALHHTRQYLELFRRLGVPEERVRVVLNRAERSAAVGVAEATRFLGRGIDARVPNDYAVAQTCVNEGRAVFGVAPRREVCAAIDQLARRAHSWCGVPLPEAPARGPLARILRRRAHGAA